MHTSQGPICVYFSGSIYSLPVSLAYVWPTYGLTVRCCFHIPEAPIPHRSWNSVRSYFMIYYFLFLRQLCQSRQLVSYPSSQRLRKQEVIRGKHTEKSIMWQGEGNSVTLTHGLPEGKENGGSTNWTHPTAELPRCKITSTLTATTLTYHLHIVNSSGNF